MINTPSPSRALCLSYPHGDLRNRGFGRLLGLEYMLRESHYNLFVVRQKNGGGWYDTPRIGGTRNPVTAKVHRLWSDAPNRSLQWKFCNGATYTVCMRSITIFSTCISAGLNSNRVQPGHVPRATSTRCLLSQHQSVFLLFACYRLPVMLIVCRRRNSITDVFPVLCIAIPYCCSLDERQRLSSSASRFWTNSLTAADSLTVISATTRLV